MSLNKTTNIKFSDFRNEFFVNKTFTPIKCSNFYPTNNSNTTDIPNIPIFPVANSTMKLSYFKNIGKTLFNILVSGTESTIKTIPQPVDNYNSGILYHLRLLHQGSTNTSTTANYTEYTIRFPYTITAHVLLVGGGGGGGAGLNNYMYGGGGHPGKYINFINFTFNENQIYKIRVGAGGLGMQSSLDTTTIDGTSSIIYDNTNSPLVTMSGGKRGNNILYYSLNTITSTSNITCNITLTTSVTNILIPLRATNIIYNYTDTIINNMPSDLYNVTFTNGSINVGTLPSNKSYPILKTGSTILSPLLWYKFDNSLINSGSLGNLYDLINNIANENYNTSDYIKGLSSLYLAKSATNAFVRIPNGTLNFNAINKANGISFSLWINTFSSAGTTIFYFGTLTGESNNGEPSRYISLVKNYYNFFSAIINASSVDGNAVTISDAFFEINVNIPNNSWVHLVWTITSAGIWTIYINKQFINPSITQQIPEFTYSNKYYYIGKGIRYIGNVKFDGLIDDFRIYDFPLTQSQVNELYNGRVDISYTSDVCVTTEFTFTNTIQYFTIPNGVKFINIYCWGAGGGGSKSYYSGNLTDGGRGGNGGFVMGTLDVSTINKLDIIVGEGGRKGIKAARCGNAFGGGGDAGNIGDNNWAFGGGGGLSGVFTNVYMNEKNIETYSTPIIIAGGGGASSATNSYHGGNAGGQIGNDGGVDAILAIGSGKGGTQSSGGSGGMSGYKFNGGSTVIYSYNYGGGGGSGYYGGGATNVTNNSRSAGGGGGSSYIAPNLINSSIPNATGNGITTVNGSTNKYYKNNAGLGANVGLNNGNDGLVVIEYLLNSNIIYGSGNGGNTTSSSYTTNYQLISATDLNKGTGGNGENAYLTNITGLNEYYAAGGGGSSYLGTVGLGGIGASGVYLGGNGTNNSSLIKISHAVANTGSGGGGSACDGINPSIGGNGSAGICIIRYQPFIDYPPMTTLNFTSTLISQNKYNVTINTLDYVVNFSSFSDTNYPYFVLKRNSQSWMTSTTYDSSGNYMGSAYLVDNYKGEWVYYKFPYSIALDTYEILSSSSSGYPLLWKIYGSNDETNWEEITEASNNQNEEDGRTFNKYLNVLPKTYKYIGIVINKVKSIASGNIYLYLTGFYVNGRVHNLTNLL
jgi:hypothetical protein